MESEAESDFSDRPPVDLYIEEGVLSDDQDVIVTDLDQAISEEQMYRETMQGIRSYMGWSHIPDMETYTNTSEDNPFACPKTQVPGKVSVLMPADDWLCRKLNKLNLTLVEGYPSRSSEASGLLKNQFLRPAKSQAKCYGLFFNQKGDSTDVLTWNTDASYLNRSYSRITRQARLASTPPTSHEISQENLHKWEKSAREATVICNQAGSFNGRLFKVQQGMHS